MPEKGLVAGQISAYDAALARVKAYRQQLEQADEQADRHSLERAQDLELLYKSMRWVDELPAPPHKIWRGRPVDPRSRSRFGAWVHQTTGLHPSRVKQLHNAHETLAGIMDTGVSIIPTGEGALRPFARLRRAGYGERVVDVYKRAVQIAEGRPPSSTETKQAVRDYLAQWSPQQRAERSLAERARSHRLKAQTAVTIMFRDGDRKQIEEFHRWYMSQHG